MTLFEDMRSTGQRRVFFPFKSYCINRVLHWSSLSGHPHFLIHRHSRPLLYLRRIPSRVNPKWHWDGIHERQFHVPIPALGDCHLLAHHRYWDGNNSSLLCHHDLQIQGQEWDVEYFFSWCELKHFCHAIDKQCCSSIVR